MHPSVASSIVPNSDTLNKLIQNDANSFENPNYVERKNTSNNYDSQVSQDNNFGLGNVNNSLSNTQSSFDITKSPTLESKNLESLDNHKELEKSNEELDRLLNFEKKDILSFVFVVIR